MIKFEKVESVTSIRNWNMYLAIDPKTIDLGTDWKAIDDRFSTGMASSYRDDLDYYPINPFAFENLKDFIQWLNAYAETSYNWKTYGREWCFIKPSFYFTVLGLPLGSLSPDFDWGTYMEKADIEDIFGKRNNNFEAAVWCISHVIPPKRYGFIDLKERRLQRTFYTTNEATERALHAPIETVEDIKKVNPYWTNEHVVITAMQSTRAIAQGSLSTSILSGKVPTGAVLISASKEVI